MGKGVVYKNLESGRYSVVLKYGQRDRIDDRITSINQQIDYLNLKKIGMAQGDQLSVINLQIAALTKEKNSLERYMPSDPIKTIWCVDLTTDLDLTAEIGLIEVPAEWDRVDSSSVLIRPGHSDGAAYNEDRDKILVPQIAQSPAQWFYNRSVLPGVEKWRPRYRFGTIVNDSLDFGSNTCSVCLFPTYSSQQNLDVNQNQTYSDCPTSTPSGFTQFCNDNPAHPT